MAGMTRKAGDFYVPAESKLVFVTRERGINGATATVEAIQQGQGCRRTGCGGRGSLGGVFRKGCWRAGCPSRDLKGKNVGSRKNVGRRDLGKVYSKCKGPAVGPRGAVAL